MAPSKTITNWIIKQNILKNLTVAFLTVTLLLWIKPYLMSVKDSGLDIFFFLSIFPLGSMFAYFAFSYSETNLNHVQHRILADLATFIFLLIICFSVALSTLIAVFIYPQMTMPFMLLATLLISGCLIYDFWNLYSNVAATE